MRDIKALRREIKKAYQKVNNWRKVAYMFGISPAMAWRISEQNYEPKDAKIRLLLGLSAMGEAPVCPYCGEVHVARGCPVRRKKRKVRSLFDVPVVELRRMIEEREEFKPRIFTNGHEWINEWDNE